MGSVVSSRVVSGTKFQPKTNLVHSRAVIKPLVAVIFNILKYIFYTRLIKILHNDSMKVLKAVCSVGRLGTGPRCPVVKC